MIYKPYSVVVVPFPFVDSINHKRRPALVISSEAHQKATHHISLMMITTAKQTSWQTDYIIQELNNTGLSIESWIRQKIFTLDCRTIIKKVGELTEKDKKNIIKLLKHHIAI
ncbi:MAG: hypothetical protein A3F46_00525 [Legionellales bacterium RIFCSPHIGHO2_12_FULL_42_9]|nr:MAG: hypothetical protein A3F46_00525 [Legionellales bacterium RIFCSPHIGHO2_12_FULL_42_9]